MRQRTMILALCLFIACCKADLPIHCLKAQVEGRWKFYLGETKKINQPDDATCGFLTPSGAHDAMQNLPDKHFQTRKTMTLILDKYNHIQDAHTPIRRQIGNWTMMYDEAMILSLERYSMFIFFKYTMWEGPSVSDCAKTLIGWYRDLKTGKIGCFHGRQELSANLISKVSRGEVVFGISTLPYKGADNYKKAFTTAFARTTSELIEEKSSFQDYSNIFSKKMTLKSEDSPQKLFVSYAKTNSRVLNANDMSNKADNSLMQESRSPKLSSISKDSSASTASNPAPSDKSSHQQGSTDLSHGSANSIKSSSASSSSQTTSGRHKGKKRKFSPAYTLEKLLTAQKRKIRRTLIKNVKIDQNEIKVSNKPKSMTVDKGYDVKQYDVRVHVHWMWRPKTDAQLAQELKGLAQVDLQMLPPLSAKAPSDDTNSKQLVEVINQSHLGWKAFNYPHLAEMTYKDLNMMVGRPRLATFRSYELDYSTAEDLASSSSSDIKKNLPAEFSLEKYLSEPRSQKVCGNCYLIATIGMLEARLRLKYGRDMPLSIQYLNDCNFYAQGCQGGFSYEVLRYVREFWAVPEHCKPFLATQGLCSGHCNIGALKEVVTVDEPYYVGGSFGKTTEEGLMTELYENGPVVISFEPTLAFTFYKEGVFQPLHGTVEQSFHGDRQWIKVDHSVLLFGWGEENGVKFWHVQNSWGKNWGQNGNFKILRGRNTLGIELAGEGAHPRIVKL